MKRSIDMYVFSKPMTRREDLEQWKKWFMSHPLNPRCAEIRKRDDGKYDLLVEGAEVIKLTPYVQQNKPMIHICKFCGEWPKWHTLPEDKSKENTGTEFLPIFFCCVEHMEHTRNLQALKHWGKSWKQLQEEGIAPYETD